MKMSFKSKILIPTMIVFTVIMTAFVGVTYYSSSRSLVENLTAELAECGSKIQPSRSGFKASSCKYLRNKE